VENQDRRLLSIQTLASFSQWLDVFLIFSVPAFAWQATAGQIATVAALFGLPILFLGPIFGAMLDRSDPRNLMLAGAIARTLFSAGIALAASFEAFTALVLAKGVANILYGPASSVVANVVVTKERRVIFFSNTSALDKLTKVLTPLIAGIAAALIPMQQLFFVSAVGTLICTALIFGLRLERPAPPPVARTVRGLVADLFAGVRAIPDLPRDLKVGMAFSIGVSLILALYDPHLAAFLSSRGFGPSAFSVVVSSTAVGAICGAALVRLRWKDASPVALIRVGVASFMLAVFAATYFAVVETRLLSVEILSAIWFVNGLGYELFVIGATVNVQNLCPQHILGRFSTSQRSLQMAAVVLGPVVGAWLIGLIGRPAPFIVSSTLGLLAFCGIALWRPTVVSSRVQSA
jgi:MFS family permease